MQSRTSPCSATPTSCRRRRPPSRSSRDRAPVDGGRHRRDPAGDPAGPDRRPVPQLPDVTRAAVDTCSATTDGSLNPEDVGTGFRRVGWRPPSCGRSGWPRRSRLRLGVAGHHEGAVRERRRRRSPSPDPWNLARLRRCRRELRRRAGAADPGDTSPALRRCPGLHDLRLRGEPGPFARPSSSIS